jgi:hypothetical protein
MFEKPRKGLWPFKVSQPGFLADLKILSENFARLSAPMTIWVRQLAQVVLTPQVLKWVLPWSFKRPKAF